MRGLRRMRWMWMGLLPAVVLSQQPHATHPPKEWNTPREPFRVYGNTYYVGTQGLSSILITSDQGHVLIDGALPESATLIRDSIRKLGFRIEDVKLIVNSHVHFDHAGGIAELQRMSGAKVAASPRSAPVLLKGASGPDDPQFGELPPIAAVSQVSTIADGETLKVGPVSITAVFTPGHTPGGTSWTWQSCENNRCVNIVYADSLTAISAKNFRFTKNEGYPNVVQDFNQTFETLQKRPCEILLTPHPEMSGMSAKLEKRNGGGGSEAFIDPNGCRAYADRSRETFLQRLAEEYAR